MIGILEERVTVSCNIGIFFNETCSVVQENKNYDFDGFFSFKNSKETIFTVKKLKTCTGTAEENHFDNPRNNNEILTVLKNEKESSNLEVLAFPVK